MIRFELLLLAISCLHAQTPDTATLRGLVLDPSGAPVNAAALELTLPPALHRTAATAPDGSFTFAALPVGSYQITARHSAFQPARANITLVGGATAGVTLTLALAAGETKVLVTGVPGEVRADTPQIGNRLDASQIQSTPLPNRRITFLPLLDAANRPAINQGDIFLNQNLFTTNGAGRRQTWFEIDGATGNDAWGRQTLFTNLPEAAVQELAILENAFSAEYGGSTGSAINIVTRSGGDRFHGELLELWRPAAVAAALSGFTAANAASGNDVTSDSLGQSSLLLTGPLARHTQFAAAAEFSREDRASPITSPVAPGSFLGRYRGWLGFIRLDHQFQDRHTVFLRGSLDGFHDTNPNGAVGGNNLPTVDRIFRRRTGSLELGETAVLTPNWINSLRAQFQLASPVTEFDPLVYGAQYQVPISTGGVFTSGTSQSALLINRQYQVNDTLAASLGKHQLKFGGDAILARSGGNSKEFGGPIPLGQFVFKPCTLALTVCESPAFLGDIANVRTYTQSYGDAHYLVTDHLWALFVQDDYRLRPNFTLNLGLRYERQTFTDSALNFAPRAGFAWNLGGRGDTVLRGGFGIYYSQIPDNAQANYALTGPAGVFNYTAAPGQPGFPASVAAAPLPAFPAAAVAPIRNLYIRPGQSASLDRFFPTSTLVNYQNRLLSPYSEQWTFSLERRLRPGWLLRADYVGSHTLRINRPLDVNAPASFVRTAPGQVRTPQAANCTRPYWVWWYAQHSLACSPMAAGAQQPPYATILSDVNNGYSFYDALNLNLRHTFAARYTLLASYTWSHALDNVDPDIPGQNPNDALRTGRSEKAAAIFDQRHRFVLSGFYQAPGRISFGGVATLASGLPFNYLTGLTNSGDTGATADRPVLNGAVVGRNAGRGRALYDFAPFLEKSFFLSESFHLDARAEAFNVFNHANFVGYSGTWGNGAAPGPGFGAPMAGIAAQLPARSLQFSVKLAF